MADVTVDKAGASPATSSELTSKATTTGVTSSGTASEALLKAVSSAEAEEQSNAGPAAKVSGDTTAQDDKTGVVATEQPATGDKKPDGTAKPDATADALPEARAVALTRNARTQLQTYLGTQLGLTNEMGAARQLLPSDLPDLKAGYSLVRELRNDATAFFLQLGSELGYEFPKAETPDSDYTKIPASLKSEDGREAFSKEDVLKVVDMVRQQVMGEVTGQIQPLREFHDKSVKQSEMATLQAQSREQAGGILAEARKLQYFTEHEQAIKDRVQQYRTQNPNIVRSLGPVGLLYRAYNEILSEKVYPTISAEAEKRVRDENARKAAGSAIVSPTGAHGDGKKPELKNVGDLARHMENLAGANV